MSEVEVEKKRDPYALLDVAPDASEQDIRAAYKKMALQWHPDRHLTGKEVAAQNFIEGHDAYRTLMREQRRRERREKAGKSPVESDKAPSVAASDCQSFHSGSDMASESSRHSSAGSHMTNATHATHTSFKSNSHSSISGSSSQAESIYSIPSIPVPIPLSPSSSGPHSTHSGVPRSSHSKSSRSSHSGPPRSSHSASHSVRSRDEPSDHKSDRSSHSKVKSVHSTSSERRSGHHVSYVNLQRGGEAPILLKTTTLEAPTSSTPKARSRLQKKRKPDSLDESEDYVHIIQAQGIPSDRNGHGVTDDGVDELGNIRPALRPIMSPHSSSKEWMFPLELTLEELFEGTELRFRVTRRMLSREIKQSLVAIDIPRGTRAGTKIRCPGVGHERKTGGCQDVVFIVAQKPHDRFLRVKDDLILEVFVPYLARLAECGGDIRVEGIDGKKIKVNIPYPIDDRATAGEVMIMAAGMPYRKGRGDLIVRWQIVFPSTSKWDSVKKVLHMHH